MQRKPSPTPTVTNRPSGEETTTKRLRRWARQRHRDAADHVLKGVCYGIGTGLAGLAFWWFEQYP